MTDSALRPVVVRAKGTVAEPALHDGLLRRLDLRDDVVAFTARRVVGSEVEVHFTGVLHAVFNDVRQGNILLDLCVQPLDQATSEDIATLLGRDPTSAPLEVLLDRLLGTRKRDGLLVACVNPSYGCNGVVLCTAVGWRELA